eukprot:GHVP01041621.1.p1 GENE.GHVP01041621.1~~GHVP01041621.1.p1  ORF type:complete len:548 (+),score=80.34 GHVP01041621.1:2-1645(+)
MTMALVKKRVNVFKNLDIVKKHSGKPLMGMGKEDILEKKDALNDLKIELREANILSEAEGNDVFHSLVDLVCKETDHESMLELLGCILNSLVGWPCYRETSFKTPFMEKLLIYLQEKYILSRIQSMIVRIILICSTSKKGALVFFSDPRVSGLLLYITDELLKRNTESSKLKDSIAHDTIIEKLITEYEIPEDTVAELNENIDTCIDPLDYLPAILDVLYNFSSHCSLEKQHVDIYIRFCIYGCLIGESEDPSNLFNVSNEEIPTGRSVETIFLRIRTASFGLLYNIDVEDVQEWLNRNIEGAEDNKNPPIIATGKNKQGEHINPEWLAMKGFLLTKIWLFLRRDYMKAKCDDEENCNCLSKFTDRHFKMNLMDIDFSRLNCENIKAQIFIDEAYISLLSIILAKFTRYSKYIRKVLRRILFPYPRDLTILPTEENELKEVFVMCLVSKNYKIKKTMGEFLFEICNSIPSRLVYHVGLGNAAGLLLEKQQFNPKTEGEFNSSDEESCKEYPLNYDVLRGRIKKSEDIDTEKGDIEKDEFIMKILGKQ